MKLRRLVMKLANSNFLVRGLLTDGRSHATGLHDGRPGTIRTISRIGRDRHSSICRRSNLSYAGCFALSEAIVTQRPILFGRRHQDRLRPVALSKFCSPSSQTTVSDDRLRFIAQKGSLRTRHARVLGTLPFRHLQIIHVDRQAGNP